MKNAEGSTAKASPQLAVNEAGDEAHVTELALGYTANAKLSLELAQEFTSADAQLWARPDLVG